MTARGRRKRPQPSVTAWQRDRDSGIVKGPIRVVHPVLRRLRVFWEWDPRLGYYVIDLVELDGVIAALEHDGARVDVLMAGWS